MSYETWGSALAYSPNDPGDEVDSGGQETVLRMGVVPRHHEMLLLFGSALQLPRVFPPLRTQPRNGPTGEGVACWLVPATLEGQGQEIVGKQGSGGPQSRVPVLVMTREPAVDAHKSLGLLGQGLFLGVYIFSTCRQRAHYKHIHQPLHATPSGELSLQTKKCGHFILLT